MEALKDKRIVSVSVGMSHVLALTDEGEIYGWGANEKRQICDTSDAFIQQPRLVEQLKGQKAVGVCCGRNQSLAWTDVNSYIPKMSVPFVIDLTENTFKHIDQILEIVVASSPSTQDKECLAISALNLLHLQVNHKCVGFNSLFYCINFTATQYYKQCHRRKIGGTRSKQ